MIQVNLAEVKDQLSKYLRLAGHEPIIITKHSKPADILIGFETEEDWFDFRLENDPRFLAHIQSTRENIKAGKGTYFEE